MSSAYMVLACLISALPGPPGVRYEDAYLQLIPVDKTKCSLIDPMKDIAYHLFTRNNPLMPDILKIGDDVGLEHSHFNLSDPTVIFFHAFMESSTATTAWMIKMAYLQKKQHNLIILNAPRMEAGPWYFTAARNTRVVGEYTAKFIDYLISRGMHLQTLHLVGLSLGAQMAGVTGSNLKSGRVPRITGLDPAGPIFTKLPNSLKLDRSDADFVDVIHTDAGIFGYPKAIGHVDFWPNAGISPQPGCKIPDVKRRNPDTIVELLFCSHWRSYQFYAESIINKHGFLSISCKNWNEFVRGECNTKQLPVHMGYNVPIGIRGNYYLVTNPDSPFSLQANPKVLAESRYEKQHEKGILSMQQGVHDIKNNWIGKIDPTYPPINNEYSKHIKENTMITTEHQYELPPNHQPQYYLQPPIANQYIYYP